MDATSRELLRFRSLLATLVARELKARYRGSLLGYFWSLANPLLLTAVYTLVFSVVFRPRFEGIDPYVLFLITGLFPWIWVSSSVLEGTVSLSGNAALIRKAVFPFEVLPVVSVVANLTHFLLAVPVLAAALIAGRVLGFEVGGWSSLLLPAVVALQLPLVAGLALALAALNAHFKDVRDLVAHVVTLVFFLTPIIYPLGAIPLPRLRQVLELNPFTPFTLAYQQLLFHDAVPVLALWAKMAAIGLVGWLAGSWVFRRLRETLVEAV